MPEEIRFGSGIALAAQVQAQVLVLKIAIRALVQGASKDTQAHVLAVLDHVSNMADAKNAELPSGESIPEEFTHWVNLYARNLITEIEKGRSST